MIDLREAPSADHPRPDVLPGIRLRLAGDPTGSIWIADREPPLPHGFEAMAVLGDEVAA